MKTQFFDRQNTANPINGTSITDFSVLQKLLESLRGRIPFFAELICDNGSKLLLGVGGIKGGCVQFSTVDGAPPYLMAVSPNEEGMEGEQEFLIGNTSTPIPKRYCLPHETFEAIVSFFVQTGERMSDAQWDEI